MLPQVCTTAVTPCLPPDRLHQLQAFWLMQVMATKSHAVQYHDADSSSVWFWLKHDACLVCKDSGRMHSPQLITHSLTQTNHIVEHPMKPSMPKQKILRETACIVLLSQVMQHLLYMQSRRCMCRRGEGGPREGAEELAAPPDSHPHAHHLWPKLAASHAREGCPARAGWSRAARSSPCAPAQDSWHLRPKHGTVVIAQHKAYCIGSLGD